MKMLSKLTPERVAIAAVVLNVILCLVLSFLVYPAIEDVLDRSYRVAFDEYDILARNLLHGNGFASYHGEPSVIRGPGYPAFLWLMYATTGEGNFTAVRLVQALLSGVIVWLTFLLGARLSGNRWIGALAALIIAIHPVLIWYTFRLVLDTQFTLICTVGYLMMLWILEHPTIKNAALLGLVLACAAYFKSVTLVYPFVFLIVLLFNRVSLKKTVLVCGTALLVLLVVISPWTWRNYQITGRIVPVHATLAAPIMYGYHEANTWDEDPLTISPGIMLGYQHLNRLSEEMGFGPASMPPKSLEEELRIEQAAIAFYKDIYSRKPGKFIEHTIARFLSYWYERMNIYASILMIFVSAFMLTFGTIGFFHLKANRKRWLAFFFIGLYVGIHTLLIGEARFQHTTLPLFATLAAAGVFRVFQGFFQRLPSGSPDTEAST